MRKMATVRTSRDGECAQWTRMCFSGVEGVQIVKCENGRIRVRVTRRESFEARPPDVWKLAFMQAHAYLAVRLPEMNGAIPLFPAILDYRVDAHDVHHDDWFIAFSLVPAHDATTSQAATYFGRRTIQAPLEDLVRTIALTVSGATVTLRVH